MRTQKEEVSSSVSKYIIKTPSKFTRFKHLLTAETETVEPLVVDAVRGTLPLFHPLQVNIVTLERRDRRDARP